MKWLRGPRVLGHVADCLLHWSTAPLEDASQMLSGRVGKEKS
jgi:hypothetical protein